MDPEKTLLGKRILIVDDETDILETLYELLSVCKIDAVTNFEEAANLLRTHSFDVAILDIMGVNGFDLLDIANERGIPVLFLTAHALTEESLKRAAEKGASYFVPKEEIGNIPVFLCDVLVARTAGKNPWMKWFERLTGYFDIVFTGPNWREREKDFWDRKLRQD